MTRLAILSVALLSILPVSSRADASTLKRGAEQCNRDLLIVAGSFAEISGALPGSGCCGLRQPGEVGLVRRLPVKAGVGSPSIVEGQIPADRGPGLADRVVGPEINLLVLD